MRSKLPAALVVLAFAAAAAFAREDPARSLVWFVPEGADLDTEVKSTGYGPNEARLYESLPSADLAREIGLGAIGIPCSHPWRKRFRPEPLPRRNLPQLRKAAESAPIRFCDLVVGTDSHARMSPMENIRPYPAAWPSPASASIPYSIVTDDGLALWQTIWTEGAKADADDFRDTPPMAYRLFENAELVDYSSGAKSASREFFRERFHGSNIEFRKTMGSGAGTISGVGRFQDRPTTLATYVLHEMFLEESFLRILSEATNRLSAPVFFQPASGAPAGIDLERAARLCTVIFAAPTRTEHPLYTARFFATMADGKPVLSPWVVPSANADATTVAIRTQWSLGYAFATLSPARRAPRSWTRYHKNPATNKTELDAAATEAAGRASAARFPGNWLNPYVVPPAELLNGLANASGPIVEPIPASPAVAILHSRASERIRGFEKPESPSLAAYAEEILQRRPDASILLESNAASEIPEGTKLLVVPDTVDACPADVLESIRRFVARGGILAAGPKALSRNEFGVAHKTPLDPPGTETAGIHRIDGDPTTFAEEVLRLVP